MKKSTTKKYILGDYLRELREKKGVSLKEVEKAIGASNAYISQLETGTRKKLPEPDRLRAIADYYNVSITELLNKAGYYESNEIQETYEQFAERAFLHAISDPRFAFGIRIKPKNVPMDIKRYILEMYAYTVRKSILFSRLFPSGEIINKDKARMLYWKTDDVKRDSRPFGEKVILRYRVKVTCWEAEGEMVLEKGAFAGLKRGTEKTIQTATGEGTFEDDASNLNGYESLWLVRATDNAVKDALSKIKGANWVTKFTKAFEE